MIELVVGAGIMALILAAGYVCLSAGLMSRKTMEARSETIQNARVAMAHLVADLRGASPLSGEFEFLGVNGKVGEAEADHMGFATHHYTPRGPREGDFCEVSYSLEPEPGSGLFGLWRRRDASPDEEPLAGGSREEICRGLKEARFEYYDGLEWFEEWGDPEGRYRGQQDPLLLPNNVSGLPEAVRITLLFAAEPSGASKPRPDRGGKPSGDELEEQPPLVFQTVVRLELAPIAASRSYARSGEGQGSNAGEAAASGSSPERSQGP